MNKNTILILCSTSGRISRKIFAMNYHFIPLKMDQKFSKKPQESPLDCSSHISFAWYYHEKPQLHRKFESHGSQRQKKTEMGDFYELIYLEPMKHPRIQNGRLDDDSFFFAMERWLDIIKPPSIHKWLAKWIPRYLFFMFRIGIPKFHGKFSRTKSNLRKLWSLIFGHTVSQTKKKSKTYRQIKNPCPLLLKNPLQINGINRFHKT